MPRKIQGLRIYPDSVETVRGEGDLYKEYPDPSNLPRQPATQVP